MLDKHFLESFLKMNAPSGNMTPGEVQAVLLNAGWSESEITAALALLRGEDDPETVRNLQGVNPLTFRPDMDFSSQDLSALLGVDVVIDPTRVRDVPQSLRHDVGALMLKVSAAIFIGLLALGVAAGIAATAAYVLKIGPFSA